VTEEKPLYEHDCTHCTFLGTGEYAGRAFDLYFCNQGHLLPTVIARASSDPHDYSSGLQLAAIDPVLREAYERARKAGLAEELTFEEPE
jgi:hypothetical protein